TIKAKFDEVRAYGVKHFAAFVDDSNHPGPIAEAATLFNDLNAHVKKTDPTDHLLIVFWDYCCWPTGSTDQLGPLLDKDVEVMWTGKCIEPCTMTRGDIDPVNKSFQRTVSIWDNWPTVQPSCCGSPIEMVGRAGDLPSSIFGFYTNPVLNECHPDCGTLDHWS